MLFRESKIQAMHQSNLPATTTHPINPGSVVCKNCDHLFAGNYCPNCGQSVKDFDKPIQVLFIDFAGNLFAFDTRVWKSLKHILFFPGKMELQYTMGKRRRYMPPFRMYVFASFLFFLTLTFATGRSIRNNNPDAALQINFNEINDKTFSAGMNSLTVNNPDQPLLLADSVLKSQKINLPLQDSLASHALSGGQIPYNPIKDSKVDMESIMKNPEHHMERFFKYLSWILFILMPFYGFLLWWNFRKSYRFILPHFLLSVNQHVFFFILIIMIVGLQTLWPGRTFNPEKYLFFAFPLYAWLGAHRLYKRRWFSTTLRMLGVMFFYGIIAMAASITVLYFSLV